MAFKVILNLLLHESKGLAGDRAKNTSCKMHETCYSALVNLNDYFFYHLILFFMKKDCMILIYFYHLSNETNYKHLNHSFQGYLRRDQCVLYVCMCVLTYLRAYKRLTN